MQTFFAPPARADNQTVSAEITLIDKSPVMATLLHSISGLLAIVNEQRQVVALNDPFLSFLGITDSASCLGLRPGEIVHCIHANEEPAGCGTTLYCQSCGAAVAMVTSFESGVPNEQKCALTTETLGISTDLILQVKAHPVTIEGCRFLLLFLHDITRQEQQSALERIFFHDISNTISSLIGVADLLAEEYPGHLSGLVQRLSLRLVNELTVQRCLSQESFNDYKPVLRLIVAGELLEEVRQVMHLHPAAAKRAITMSTDCAETAIITDHSLIMRIFCNMTINALEATDEQGEIKIWAERTNDTITFCVWNRRVIPDAVAPRIFQRYFSTKAQAGRGIGTYSMKLFGETYLKGSVFFTSSVENGTTFCFSLPVATPHEL